MPEARPKIAVITPYWPFPKQPHRGQSAYQTLRLLTPCAGIRVFCPVPVYPKWLRPKTYGYEAAQAGFSPEGVPTCYPEYPAVPVLTRPVNGWMIARRILPLVREFGPSLVLNYCLYPEGYAAVAVARSLGVPSILCAIGSDLKRIPDRPTRILTRRAVARADFIMAVSEDLRQEAVRFAAAPARTGVVLNGCDTSIFTPGDRAAARQNLGISADERLIVFVGWIDESKGVRELQDAVEQLVPRFPRIRAVLIGEGSMQEKSGSPHLQWPGWQDSRTVARWLHAADLFCLPSYSEGCPNVVVEALATGCPVVATRVGGIPELIDADCGMLVPPRDTAALANALSAALERPWDRDAIARLHRRSWADAASETLQICQRVLERKRGVGVGG